MSGTIASSVLAVWSLQLVRSVEPFSFLFGRKTHDPARYLLLASSVCMGGVGIFSMHFVSSLNPACILDNY